MKLGGSTNTKWYSMSNLSLNKVVVKWGSVLRTVGAAVLWGGLIGVLMGMTLGGVTAVLAELVVEIPRVAVGGGIAGFLVGIVIGVLAGVSMWLDGGR